MKGEESFPRDERGTVTYWLDRSLCGEELLLTEEERLRLNRSMREKSQSLADLSEFPEELSRDELQEMILAAQQDFRFSETPGEHYDGNGFPIGQEDYGGAKRNCNLTALAKKNPVGYALTCQRVNLRLLPTKKNYFDHKDFRHYDDLQGTALDPAEPLLLLHRSLDGEYAFVRARHYAGWVDFGALALAERSSWATYVHPEEFLVVTENQKEIFLGRERLLFQMGSILPLCSEKKEGAWRVRIPGRNGGCLRELEMELPKDETLHRGWLPCTGNQFLRQAFKFLGDGYGWGGMEDSVDCSAFVGDVYRSMGLEIPRDADQQELAMPELSNLVGLSTAERYACLEKTPPGALLFLPGHVMLCLGADGSGTPFAIHAASSYYTFSHGMGEKHYVRRVLVSDLRLRNRRGVEFINGLTGIGYVKKKGLSVV